MLSNPGPRSSKTPHLRDAARLPVPPPPDPQQVPRQVLPQQRHGIRARESAVRQLVRIDRTAAAAARAARQPLGEAWERGRLAGHRGGAVADADAAEGGGGLGEADEGVDWGGQEGLGDAQQAGDVDWVLVWFLGWSMGDSR
jgi:hypothetical protein